MTVSDEFRARTRATWAAGNWDDFSAMIAPVGRLVLERAALEPGIRVVDIGTGTGGNVAIPAALAGARVVGADLTPELLVHARRRAADAGVEVEFVEADAAALPFDDASFDRVISTFGAMFAPDHARAASELVRVCAPGGRVLMTTWSSDGFAGELFKLTGSYMPPPPGVQSPVLWGAEAHVQEMFAAAGAEVSVVREHVEFVFAAVADAVNRYAEDFGPFVAARSVLEPDGRWDEFLGAFADLIRRFNPSTHGDVRMRSEYLLITVRR